MSLVITARSRAGQNSRHRLSTRAVFPEPTGPPTPSVSTRRRGPWYVAAPPPAPISPCSWCASPPAQGSLRRRRPSGAEDSRVKSSLSIAGHLVGGTERARCVQLHARRLPGQPMQFVLGAGEDLLAVR